MGVIRVAVTQTRNAFAGMPPTVAALGELKTKLDLVRSANVEHHLGLLAAAAQRGVQVVGFGELFAAPYFGLSQEPMWRTLAEDARTGATVSAIREAAAALGMVVIAPIYELATETGERFNTAVVIDADGSVLGSYRKLHIPSGTNEVGSFDERFYYRAGDGRQRLDLTRLSSLDPCYPVFCSAVGRIAVAICYDRHFAYVAPKLVEGGAQLIFVPAVTFGAKARRLWELEFEVDAARHRVFVAGSNRIGAEPPWGQEFFGQSHIVGPEGRLEDRSDHPELIVTDVDLDSLAGADPSGWSLARDRQVDSE